MAAHAQSPLIADLRPVIRGEPQSWSIRHYVLADVEFRILLRIIYDT